MVYSKDYTTIKITKKMRYLLGMIAHKNETYEDILLKILKKAGYENEINKYYYGENNEG